MPVKSEEFVAALWFKLELAPGTPVGYFTEISGLSTEVETLTYNEGGRNDMVHKLPTRMKHPNLVLKRGVTGTKELERWAEDCFMGPERKEITLTMYDSQNVPIRVWSFQEAYPVKWTGPTFNVSQAAAATEALEIVHTGKKIVS